MPKGVAEVFLPVGTEQVGSQSAIGVRGERSAVFHRVSRICRT